MLKFIEYLQVCKAWEGRVTACCSKRVQPLAKLLGADHVVPLPIHDPEEAEQICEDAFSNDENFDVCIITLEDSSLNESFCQQFSNSVVKTSSPR